ncbi:MAG TPA: tRNA (adenosine(37)-N6)-threonylcarbamoyltransferase complex dimerization subunit type 1 TsaB [Paludibacteraceae bacterium]|nr:tRNA (adenosine(37)-N6)-threonylcarbamoyltransferase complex dimerization subunit type 1 TsaB [Paludibacteraceae bacterium]HRR58759.1 tRNA (adenosine(37)-N6)-threonylcarbamoyltransferase complex dimerization subunit type 1 TsaB [Paludibacteraceae bacterium]HRU72556.1 tRNA (adenosine(37)-N6)-threonylcarbamoyltransferase complex dimerization subunit type 1 TsaB [Paludibacteraceae bacterium]
MAVILHIETSTDICSIALSENGIVRFSKLCPEGPSHAVKLPLFIEETLNFAHKNGLKPQAVAVSAGPGSYTGLRIGVSSAKGLCFGWNAKLLAIDTLKLIAQGALKQLTKSDALICPMIDARRMEVYSAVYDAQLNIVQSIEAKIIDENAFADLLDQRTIFFCGNGAAKCQNIITHANARFLTDIQPLAENMPALAEKAFANQEFQDVAYFEPFYLKEFITTVPKSKF